MVPNGNNLLLAPSDSCNLSGSVYTYSIGIIALQETEQMLHTLSIFVAKFSELGFVKAFTP